MNKSKKILVLVSKRPKDLDGMNWHGLKKWLNDLLGEDVSVDISSLNELVYSVGKNAAIYDPAQKYDIADFDVVIFRTVGEELEHAIAAAHYLRAKKVSYTDSYLLTQGRGKLACSFARWGNGLPTPNTVYSAPALMPAAVKKASLKYPMILKADYGKKGNDNYLVKSESKLKEILAECTKRKVAMIAQEFIANDGDYRILVMNGKPVFAFCRKGSGESHLNNTSKGGEAFKVSLGDLDSQILEEAKKAAQLEKLEVAGVDIIIDKASQKTYILEVNRAPQLPTGAFAQEKMEVYAGMIKELLNAESLNDNSNLPKIGRAEFIDLVNNGIKNVPVKVDTGADLSSIWASEIKEQKGSLSFTLFGKGSEFYTGKKITLSKEQYQQTRIANSFGAKEVRYLVKLKVKVNGRIVNGSFTLADRSMKIYPILIGRRLLKNKFLVDVAAGRPLIELERNRKNKLHIELNIDED